ncbi:hypothetical protein ACOMHN_052806 [Nucella lapillus]
MSVTRNKDRHDSLSACLVLQAVLLSPPVTGKGNGSSQYPTDKDTLRGEIDDRGLTAGPGSACCQGGVRAGHCRAGQDWLLDTVLRLTADYQYGVVMEAAARVEKAGGHVLGSITDNHKTTGANCFMTSTDVFSASQKRLAKHAASFLESIEVESVPKEHICLGVSIDYEDAASMEMCTADVTLTASEESSAAYVAGWLESKCEEELSFTDEDPLVTSEAKDFIHQVSRGKLKTPHACTFQLVRIGLSFLKKARHRACCRKRLTGILCTLASFNDIDITCEKLFRRLSNVLLHGLHNLERDHEKDAVLLQTSVKKARML